jgi:hypothetical protein
MSSVPDVVHMGFHHSGLLQEKSYRQLTDIRFDSELPEDLVILHVTRQYHLHLQDLKMLPLLLRPQFPYLLSGVTTVLPQQEAVTDETIHVKDCMGPG